MRMCGSPRSNVIAETLKSFSKNVSPRKKDGNHSQIFLYSTYHSDDHHTALRKAADSFLRASQRLESMW